MCSSEACYLPVDSTVNGTVYALKEDKFENAGTFCMSKNVINVVTLGLSLATTIVASLTAYMNPAARWHHLKTSALALESEIWGFRTRTGKYRENRISAARSAEHEFQKTIKGMEQDMLQSGDLRRTVFFSKPASYWDRHGQHGVVGVKFAKLLGVVLARRCA